MQLLIILFRARHLVSPNVYLGSLIDAESNGQPNITATGDDATGVDDEDGVTIPPVVTIASTVSITVLASVNGFLDAWIDYNVDGDWADAGEHVFISQALAAGSNSLSFIVPATATSGQSYSRFRFRTTSIPINYDGQVNDGEVEDYATYLEPPSQGSLDYGDAPDNWDIPNDYPTLLASNGARHTIVAGVYMGALIDAEANGQPNNPSTGDDIAGMDDEDGVTMPSFILQGAIVGITVVASTSGFLDAWIDYNLDGNWSAANEHIFTSQAITTGSNSLTFTVPLTASMGPSYSRFKFRTSNALISYDGLVSYGEVEDYAVYIEGSPQLNFDFGDVPDNPGNATDFPTLLASNGARHTIANNTYLGTLIDAETNGMPSVAANGDNISGMNDEDGITFLWPLSPGNPCKIQVVASVNNAFLNMWIDYNWNGTWVETGEHVLTDVNPVAGINYYTFIVPLSAIPGPTYARFRFSHQPALSYSGSATDGEVEDYRLVIQKTSHKWHQLPDNGLPGLHSDYTNVVADDWVCNGGVVTELDWWGNYEMTAGVENRGDGISHFQVTAYSDAGCQPETAVLSYDVPFSSIQEVNSGLINNESSSIYKYSFILPVPYDQLITHTYWISVRAIPNNPAAPAAWRWQEASRVFSPIHCPTVSFDATGSWQPIVWPDPAPGQYSGLAFSVINSQSKTMNLKVYLEGLYTGNGVMHKAQDGLVDSSDMIDVDNAGAGFAIGYIATDINGDGIIDSSDMIIIDNNATGFIGAILP